MTPTLPISGAVIVDELPGVRRIGEDLLVAGHRRREDGLAGGRAARAEGLAFEDGAVGEDEMSALAFGIASCESCGLRHARTR